ncbi:hypothetical protein WJX74_009472 [Apatococcus lobatus]|uniref:BZIP domain-containing protein n=1 Tax=Apatococcus lobatus TaxID=904363 RepID=A0AAW1QMR0_9CHLO
MSWTGDDVPDAGGVSWRLPVWLRSHPQLPDQVHTCVGKHALHQQPDLLPHWLCSKAEEASGSCFTGDSAASFTRPLDATSTPLSDADCMLELLDWLPGLSTITDPTSCSTALPCPIATPDPWLISTDLSPSSTALPTASLDTLVDAPEPWLMTDSSRDARQACPSSQKGLLPHSLAVSEVDLKSSIGAPSCSTATQSNPSPSNPDSAHAWLNDSPMLDDLLPLSWLDHGSGQSDDWDTLSDLPSADISAPSSAQPMSQLSSGETSCTLSSGISAQLHVPDEGQRTKRRYKQKTGRPRRYDTYVAPVEEPEGELRVCREKRRGAPQRHAYSTQEEGLAKRRDRNRSTALNSYYKRKERTAQLEAERDALERENAALREILQTVAPDHMSNGLDPDSLTDLRP